MTARDVQIALTIAAVDVLDVAIEELSIAWGRGDLYDQPDVATLTMRLDVDRAGWSVDDLPFEVGADVVVSAPLAGEATETVFEGRVSDLDLDHDDDTDHAIVRVLADDPLAQLAHVYLGDEPWPEESAIARATRIASLLPAGLAELESEFGALPERLWTVRDRDVDRQPALSLMQQVAESTDTGLYLVIGEAGETHRKYLYHGLSLDHPGREFVLTGPPAMFVIEPSPGVAEVTISADHLTDGVNYRKGLAQLVTQAQVDYYDPIGDADVSVIYTNGGAEAIHGTRRLQLRTQLVDQADAETLAGRALARGVPSWRTETLVWDASDGGPAVDPDLTLQRFLRLRDRVGLGVEITDLPAWVPSEADYVFYEGGVLTYRADRHDQGDGHPGRWIVTMAVVPSAGIGAGITYAQALSSIPGMTYQNIDPTVRYVDALSVGV